MSEADRNTKSPDILFHPASHYQSPDEVVKDAALSPAEKRVILSSWASDMYAVESCPWLRDVPGMAHPVRLSDILAALRQLHPEDDDDPPPRGAAAMRVVPLSRLQLWRRRRDGLRIERAATSAGGPPRGRLPHSRFRRA